MRIARSSVVDVARALGVAPSTVSRAFNHPELLKPETVAAVHAAAERLGYVPNRHAQALITGRTGAIGLIVPDITNPFFPKLVRAAQRAAEQHGLSMFVAETNYDPANERRQIATMAPQSEGVIVASSRLPGDELQLLAQRTRVVFINNDTPGLARVLLSSRDALQRGIRHLSEKGSRRLCYVGGPVRSWSEGERRGIVGDCAAALDLDVSYLRAESGTYAEARALATSVLSSGADAVIAFDDVVAHGVLDGLLIQGVRVPEQVSLLGCDDALPIQTHPRVSTIRLPFTEAVRAAVGLVTSTEIAPDTRIEVEGVLELRETTRA
ncbi:LacI family DNA-binding transcriptional regulator [Streptomyces sp. AC495_CC817]|uniref:LacI family DNA-binding transcriptional regulator n=1 Tax=Streptomyces sp. AC495_CC817 TaxID=2823900 RepID=UPI001C2568F0|nr:LacI family DNA-binding transcriptional regulator [Streptomyces sp. AC495_CC817]